MTHKFSELMDGDKSLVIFGKELHKIYINEYFQIENWKTEYKDGWLDCFEKIELMLFEMLDIETLDDIEMDDTRIFPKKAG